MRHGVIAIALVVAACSRGEPEKAQARSSTPAPAIPAANAPQPDSANYAPGEALKERLARQEAAAKLLDSQPAPAPRPPEPPKAAPAVKAAPVAAKAPPPAAPARAEAVKAPEPAKVEPPPAPRTEVAAAKPAIAPAPAIRLVQRVEPDFPREAIQAGEDKGLVQARMTLDASGNVSRVEVLEAHPRRLFDRSVIRALSQWKYNEGAAGRTVEIEISFRK